MGAIRTNPGSHTPQRIYIVPNLTDTAVYGIQIVELKSFMRTGRIPQRSGLKRPPSLEYRVYRDSSSSLRVDPETGILTGSSAVKPNNVGSQNEDRG